MPRPKTSEQDRQRELAYQEGIFGRFAMLDLAATIKVLRWLPDHTIVLVHAATASIAIPAFQFNKQGDMRPEIAEINKTLGCDGRPDGASWIHMRFWAADWNGRPRVAWIDDPEELQRIAEHAFNMNDGYA